MRDLQVELVGGLGRDKFHRWTLHRLGDRLCIAEIVLLPLAVRADVLRRHQPGIMPERGQLPTEVMRADTGLHADQARRHVRKPRFDLSA
jgi:hypothetical protein